MLVFYYAWVIGTAARRETVTLVESTQCTKNPCKQLGRLPLNYPQGREADYRWRKTDQASLTAHRLISGPADGLAVSLEVGTWRSGIGS